MSSKEVLITHFSGKRFTYTGGQIFKSGFRIVFVASELLYRLRFPKHYNLNVQKRRFLRLKSNVAKILFPKCQINHQSTNPPFANVVEFPQNSLLRYRISKFLCT